MRLEALPTAAEARRRLEAPLPPLFRPLPLSLAARPSPLYRKKRRRWWKAAATNKRRKCRPSKRKERARRKKEKFPFNPLQLAFSFWSCEPRQFLCSPPHRFLSLPYAHGSTRTWERRTGKQVGKKESNIWGESRNALEGRREEEERLLGLSLSLSLSRARRKDDVTCSLLLLSAAAASLLLLLLRKERPPTPRPPSPCTLQPSLGGRDVGGRSSSAARRLGERRKVASLFLRDDLTSSPPPSCQPAAL